MVFLLPYTTPDQGNTALRTYEPLCFLTGKVRASPDSMCPV